MARRLAQFASILLLAALLPASLCAAHTVRIGVFTLFHPRDLRIAPVPGSVLRLEAGTVRLSLEGAEAARIRLSRGDIEVTAKGQSIEARELLASSPAGRISIGIPGKIQRTFEGEVAVTAARGELIVTVAMDFEIAVASVVAAEAPPGAPLEALKAQAVATRSFYWSHMSGGRHAGFDFCDTTHCQFLREPPAPTAPARQAAGLTAGLVLTFDGQPIEALFSAACGGRTHSLRELGMQPAGYPYFPAECEWCGRHAARWEKQVDAQTAALLSGRRSERVRIDLARALGWQALPGNDFEVAKRGDQWVVTGKGAGHGIGLCQRGSAAMAESKASLAEILAHYYPNTALATWPP